MTANRLLVLGTRNEGKRRELEILLTPLGFTLKTLADFPDAIDVDETGTTFRENAHLKASQQARHLKQWVLGEDSGLCVDVLDGAPGVHSARYAGTHGDDQANNGLLLTNLEGVPVERRWAGYSCHVALSDPNGEIRIECFGTCRGKITCKHRGRSGFGYDPLFEIAEYHQTFGELGDTIKSVLSHRGRAMRQFARMVAETNLYSVIGV